MPENHLQQPDESTMLFSFGISSYATQDFAKAKEFFEKAAAQGHVGAQGRLGLMYSLGEGVARDLEQALDLLETAASLGDGEAQHNLGMLYETGRGVELDIETARTWYERAAQQGVSQAQCTLGNLYGTEYKETGDEAQFTQAVEWLEKAAENRDLMAQMDLGALQMQKALKLAQGNGLEGAKELFAKALDNFQKVHAQNKIMPGVQQNIDFVTQQLQILADAISGTVKEKEPPRSKTPSVTLSAKQSDDPETENKGIFDMIVKAVLWFFKGKN